MSRRQPEASLKMAVVPETTLLRLSGEMAATLAKVKALSEAADALSRQVADLAARREPVLPERAPPVDLGPINQTVMGVKSDLDVIARKIAARHSVPPNPESREPRGPIRVRVIRRDINDNILEVETF